MKRRGIALLAALCLLLCGCEQKEVVEVPELLEPVGVRADRATAYVGEINTTKVYEGEIKPESEELYFEIDGRVLSVNVVPGQQVKAGDVLVELDEEDAVEAYEDLEEAYEYTQRMNAYDNRLLEIDLEMLNVRLAQLNRQEATEEQKRAVQNLEMDIEEKRLALKQQQERQALALANQQEQMELAASKLGKNLLRAPFDGEVSNMIWLQPGMWLSAYSPVLYIADKTQLYLESEYLFDSTLARCDRVYARVGDRDFELIPRPTDKEEYSAAVISGATPHTRYDFVDSIPENLEAGMYAAVCLVSNTVPDAILVPTNALFRDSTGRYVYVYEADGETRTRRHVTTGVTTDWLTQITEGLEEGEIVYVAN